MVPFQKNLFARVFADEAHKFRNFMGNTTLLSLVMYYLVNGKRAIQKEKNLSRRRSSRLAKKMAAGSVSHAVFF
jgi:hypothetical protein